MAIPIVASKRSRAGTIGAVLSSVDRKSTDTDDWLLPKDRLELVRESNHEIGMLAEGVMRILGAESNDDYPIFHGMLARIQQLSELQFFALRLHGECGEREIEAWGGKCDLEALRRIYAGML
ncbi:MAG: hypothetical protein OJF60_003408 [Burkholderiaceae bacterium]|jgi:hypothetical protein|nr:MAG: hypothetical protein OJF60_003408 [Burkholderiaceae bacterium]